MPKTALLATTGGQKLKAETYLAELTRRLRGLVAEMELLGWMPQLPS